MNDRELLFEAAARIVAAPAVVVAPNSAIGAAKEIIKKVRSNPDHSPYAVMTISLAAASVFAARSANDNTPENVGAAVDAVVNLLAALQKDN